VSFILFLAENLPPYISLGVVAEEMLHLSLAGNILRAVGGNPKLYDVHYIPCYPMLMPGRVPKLWLELRRANKRNLQTFVDVRISFTWRRFTLHINDTWTG
jgi:hypothetical protein